MSQRSEREFSATTARLAWTFLAYLVIGALAFCLLDRPPTAQFRAVPSGMAR